MQGAEYALVHVQEPILYVIRHQHRQSPTQGRPMLKFPFSSLFLFVSAAFPSMPLFYPHVI